MNEATKSAPFLKELRRQANKYDGVVLKHADRSTIGVPDSTITVGGNTTWMEFKLFRPGPKWSGEVVPFADIAEESKLQFENMKKLDRAGKAVYIFWIKKGRGLYIWRPETGWTSRCESTEEACRWIIDYTKTCSNGSKD